MASRPRQTSATRIPTVEEIPAREGLRAELADVDASILELQNSLRTLMDSRKLLKERLDEYTYPVLTLPSEIIALIFVHFLPVYPLCPPLFGVFAPTKLATICHHWREIALATPALWRAIQLQMYRDIVWEVPHLRVLESWLKRSRSCPLSIIIQGASQEFEEEGVADIQTLEPFVDAILSHSERWEYMKIKPPLDLVRFSGLIVHAPLLRSLSISTWLGPKVHWNTPIEAPQLRRLTLEHYCDSLPPLLPCAQLTTLCVTSISDHQFLDILHHTVNLVHCKVFFSTLLPAAAIAPRPLTLPHLETLVLLLDSWASAVPPGWFDTLTLPALRRLELEEHILDPNPIGALEALIARSRCSLQQLHLPRTTLEDAYRLAFPAVPSIVFRRGYNIGNRVFAHDASVVDYATDNEDDPPVDRWGADVPWS
ncbi:hypothetical protein B0H13DRAFT_833815 [Mycena leptocephala]|nr:hypothetical protein B0H13DRAFT_833815 [Mycena leptocephala]